MKFLIEGEPLRTRSTDVGETLFGQNPPPWLPPRGNWQTRRFAWWFLRINGWDIRGLYPDSGKFIIIGAPHSSNYDWFWGMFVQWALGVRFSFMIKSVFFFPPIGSFMRWLGGVPVDRRRAKGVVNKAVECFSDENKMILLITPEGRTKPVRTLKRGFYEIAKIAQVPVLVVSFRYDERVIALDGYIDLSDGFKAVAERLKAHYSTIKGRHRGYLDNRDMWAVRPLKEDVKTYE